MLKIGPFSIEKSYLKAGAIVAAAAALVYLFYKYIGKNSSSSSSPSMPPTPSTNTGGAPSINKDNPTDSNSSRGNTNLTNPTDQKNKTNSTSLIPKDKKEFNSTLLPPALVDSHLSNTTQTSTPSKDPSDQKPITSVSQNTSFNNSFYLGIYSSMSPSYTFGGFGNSGNSQTTPTWNNNSMFGHNLSIDQSPESQSESSNTSLTTDSANNSNVNFLSNSDNLNSSPNNHSPSS